MNYMTIYKTSLADGDGWRTVLFVAGCDHKCKGCHNPESWDENAGHEFTDEVKNDLFKFVEPSYISGLTLSGGDPLYCSNIEPLTQLCKEFKEKFPNKTIWLYTGSQFEEVQSLEIMKYVDVVVDRKFKENLRDTTIAFRGSTNQRIIDVKTGQELDFDTINY